MSEDFCFVIMPFSDELKEVYEVAVKPAVEDVEDEEVKLTCRRVDEIPGAGNIVKKIVDNIYRAKIIIADLTGLNPNVFYELGVAHALRNNVIMLAQDIQKDVPFDLKTYNVIEYGTSMGQGKKLVEDIRGAVKTLPAWTKKPNNPVQDYIALDGKPLPISRYREEIRDLQEENKRLQAICDFTEKFVKGLTGNEPEEGLHDEIIQKMVDDFINEDEVTVSIPTVPNQEPGEEADNIKRKRIIFKKVDLEQ